MEKEQMIADLLGAFLDKKTDSISVSKTSTGKYSFDVKVYSENLLDPIEQAKVIQQLKNVHAELERNFHVDV